VHRDPGSRRCRIGGFVWRLGRAGTVTAVSIASRMLSDIRGSRYSGDMAAAA